MDRLPPEIKTSVLEYLDKPELLALATVNRSVEFCVFGVPNSDNATREWYSLATDPQLLRLKGQKRIRYAEYPRLLPYHPVHLLNFITMYVGFAKNGGHTIKMYQRHVNHSATITH